MNYNQFSKSSKVDKLQLINSAHPVAIHIVPEFGTFAVDNLFTNGLLLTNCFAFISKSQQIKLGIKTFNTRKIFLDAKGKLSSQDVVGSNKTIQVLQDYPNDLDTHLDKEKKFIIVDQTVLTHAVQYIIKQSNVKNGAFFLLQQLKKEVSYLKTKHPKLENVVLFVLNETKPPVGLADILQHFVNIPANMINTLSCFDKYMIVSMSSTVLKPTLFPIAGYKRNSPVPEIYKSNLTLIDKIYSDHEKALALKAKENEVQDEVVDKSEIETKVNKYDQELDNLNINRTQLNKIFKKYNVRDKTIADNIKQAIISYVPNKSEVKNEQLEAVILSAIHKTLFNTDKIDEKYLHNPVKLFSKLEEVNTYSQEMVYPKTVDNYILEPSKTIDLKRVTGLVRHKYEFSDNIHKNIETLFDELQTRPNDPIKIMKITHKYEDNNMNRVINYEITLKNLTGKNKSPYKVNVKIPGLVNDRYFKLNGKNYILSNQQFFIPITKTEPDECRLINSYQTLTLSIANLKINISEISRFIQYIEARYPDRIKKVETDVNRNVLKAELKDENGKICKIDLTSKEPYECGDTKLVLDEDNNKYKEIINGKINKSNLGKSEYLYDVLERILQAANPIETTKKSPKTIPYIVIHLMALKIPLIIYMWQQLGLIKSLQKLGIRFEETETPSTADHVSISLENGKYLCIYPSSRREKLIVNGLYDINMKKYKFKDIEHLSDRHSIDDYLLDKDTRAVVNLDLLTANVLDTYTKDLLENDGNSTNIIDLLSIDMVDKLLNDQPDSLADLKIYRNRQAEQIFTLLYRMLMMAHRTYTSEMKFNDNAKLFLSENYVIECLLGINPHMKGNAAIELVNPYSPITELKSASKLIKTGPRGLPSKRMIKAEHRNIHSSYYGNIGANSTTEYADVGIVNHLCLSPLLSNKYGSFGIKDIRNTNGWELLTLDESLIPFVNEMNSDRAVLAYTHRAQITPIKDGEVPIVATGAEFVVPQLASNKFINLAKQDGEVLEVKENEYMKVKYDNGVTEYIDITPRLANTKRSSYISLDMNTKPVGYKFNEHEPLSWTNSFNGDAYTAGKNLTMALMNYNGYSHEDSYVISETTHNKFCTQSLQEISAVVPLNSKVFNVITDYKDTKPGEVLLEFGYVGSDIDNYLDEYNLVDETSEESEAAVYNYIGNKIQITSPGGQISEIRIYINNKTQVDPSIIQIWKKICTKLKNKVKLYSYGKTSDREKIAAMDNLDMSQLKTGTHKIRGKLFEGARIVFYIKTDRYLNVGDKVSNRFGAKGIVGKILPTEEVPKAEYSGEIEIFLSPFGLAGRKNLVIIKEMYIGKILYNLPKLIKKKLDDNKGLSETKTIDECKKLIEYVYDKLDNTPNKKYYNLIKSKIEELIKKKKFISEIEDEHLKFILMVEPFHNHISMNVINEIAETLKIPLDERIFIPSLGVFTKTKVPVGKTFIQAMEQIAEEYESLRSTGKYKFSTGQPEKGKANMGGQSLGNWDIYSLLTCEMPQVMKELMTVRSDDFKSKREMTIDIIENGEANIPIETGDAATKDLYKIHMIALGLNPV